MSIIEDGTGQGYKAAVTSNNRLDVSSRSADRIYYVSKYIEKAFTVNFEHTQATGGSSEGMGYITYTGNDSLYISKIILSSEDTGLTKFGVWADPTVSGGVSDTAINLNLTSAISSETTIRDNSDGTTVTISGGNSISTVRLNNAGSFDISFDNALILGKNDVIAIKASASTTSSKTRATIIFYEEGD